MYGQSCRVVGRGGVGPLRFGGPSLCWGRSVTTHSHRSVGIPQVRWVHLARQYIALPRPWLPLRMESSVSRDLRSHVPQMWGSSGSSPLAYVSRPGLCGGGGVVGGEEGVGAEHNTKEETGSPRPQVRSRSAGEEDKWQRFRERQRRRHQDDYHGSQRIGGSEDEGERRLRPRKEVRRDTRNLRSSLDSLSRDSPGEAASPRS